MLKMAANTRFLVCHQWWLSFRLFSINPRVLTISKCYCTALDNNTIDKTRVSIDNIRNIGIIAHIDAGKTTTTERMLYLSGFTRHLGDVDDGTTVMDYMKQERERGITVNSASITFNWNNHRINLIDTPGHIDFTFEVERSLKVLDGAITIFDSSAGVQTQTMSVWRQANRYNIPRMCFINKMDKRGANLNNTIKSIKEKLNTVPICIQYPIGEGKEFMGMVDLIDMQVLLWESGETGIMKSSLQCLSSSLSQFIETNHTIYPELLLTNVYNARKNMLEQLAMVDDTILETVINDNFNPLQINKETIVDSIKRVTHECIAVPVLVGSSLRNIGVESLLNAVNMYLPSPLDRDINIPEQLKKLFAIAFKVTHDKQRGPLVHLRLYSGSISQGSTVYNITQNKTERISRVLLALADERKEVGTMSNGNIAVVAGLKHTVTGDIISFSKASKSMVVMDTTNKEGNILSSPTVPQPMFFCSIEPESSSQQKSLDHALACLTREDPSLSVSENKETGQTILSGMGELHLGIIHDRIKREYGIATTLGQLQVSYRESPSVTVNKYSNEMKRIYNDQCYEVNVQLSLEQYTEAGDTVTVINSTSSISDNDDDEMWTAVDNGVRLATLNGPVLSYPVVQIKVTIESLIVNNPSIPLPLVTACVNKCVTEALKQSQAILLEPLMNLTLLVPESYMTIVLSDLTTTRRGQVIIIEDIGDGMKSILAHVPVSSISGYATDLRSKTSGTGSFTAQFSHYQPVPHNVMNKIKQNY